MAKDEVKGEGSLVSPPRIMAGELILSPEQVLNMAKDEVKGEGSLVSPPRIMAGELILRLRKQPKDLYLVRPDSL